MRSFLTLLCVLLAAAKPSMASPFDFEGLRAGDRATWRGEKVILESSLGIGQVTITPREVWPESLTLRFLYADGRGLTRLENLELSLAGERLTFRYPESDETRSSASPISLKINDGALEFTLLKESFGEAESLTVRWIDVYR